MLVVCDSHAWHVCLQGVQQWPRVDVIGGALLGQLAVMASLAPPAKQLVCCRAFTGM
jgi:hypothetical protein